MIGEKYMRNLVVFIMIIMNLMLVSGCSSNDVAKKNNEATVVEMTSENLKEEPIKVKTEETEVGDEENTMEIPKDFSSDVYFQSKLYSIAPSELINRDMDRPEENSEWIKSLKISYPQLYNLEDTEKQAKINDLIFKKVITQHEILENRDYIEYLSDYKIMYSDDKFFSVLFTGEVSDYRASNSFAFAMTINIEDGEEISLEKLFKVDGSFIENYLFSKFYVVDNNFDDVLDNVPYVEQYVESYSSNSHTNDFYVKKDSLGIIIPTYDSMGYILIEGKFK